LALIEGVVEVGSEAVPCVIEALGIYGFVDEAVEEEGGGENADDDKTEYNARFYSPATK
jgi:hypothetical protein